MEFKASHRFARVSARKARYVVDLVRSKRVDEALESLMFVHNRPKSMVEKVLNSAIANANEYVSRAKNDPEMYPDVDRERVDRLFSDGVEDHLYVKEAYVDEGPTAKRWQPRAYGRAYQILKRTCHIKIVLADK